MRFSRRRLIINPEFQWTIVAFAICVSIATTLVHFMVDRLQMISALAGDSEMGGGARSTQITGFVIFALFYAVLMFMGIVLSNRLAGPLYRLRLHIVDIAQGKSPKKMFFRNKDYFKDLNEAYNSLVESYPQPDKPTEKSKLLNEKGFSMVEMVVVMAIITTLAGISMAQSMFPKRTVTFGTEVARLEEALTTARNAAISRGHCAYFNILNSGQRAQIRTYPPVSGACSSAGIPELELAFDFNSGYTLSNITTWRNSRSSDLIFISGGGTTAGTPLQINISKGSERANFVIYPGIGQVRRL